MSMVRGWRRDDRCPRIQAIPHVQEYALIPESQTIVLDDTALTIAVSPAGAIPWLRDWLAFFPTAPAGPAPAIEVRKVATGQFAISTRAGSAQVTAVELEPLFDQSLRALLRNAGQRPLAHAALIGNGSNAVLLTGPSGAGKTTLVRAAARAGLCYWSDEYVLMSRKGVLGYPRCLELAQGDDLPILRSWHYRESPQLQPFGHAVGLLPARWLPWHSVPAVVHLSGDFDHPLHVERIRFRPPLWHRPARTGLWPVLLRLRRCRHFVCRGGDAEQRMGFVDRLLTGHM